jgi:cell division protein FtsW
MPPIAIVIAIMAALLLVQPDFGTPVMLVIVTGLMVFAAGLHYRYLLAAAVVGLPAAILVALSRDYRVERLVAYFNPGSDLQGSNYQVNQSLIAVGTGGVFGRGLTEGVQKLLYLPEPQNDFIYAVIAEELGLIGASGVLICFAVIAWRGLRITLRAEEPFGAFVALGITAMICAQAMINIGVVLNLLPNKGFTLPLVSAGGSSMLVCLAGIGILLNVSQHATSES